MALYTYQDGGLFTINTDTPLTVDKVTSADVNLGGSVTYTDATRSGDAAVVEMRGLTPSVEVSMTFNLLDEAGITSLLKKFIKGDPDFSNVDITERPEGTGAGKPTRTWAGMTLETKNTGYAAGRGRPPTTGTVTFTGRATQEPAWTAQS